MCKFSYEKLIICCLFLVSGITTKAQLTEIYTRDVVGTPSTFYYGKNLLFNNLDFYNVKSELEKPLIILLPSSGFMFTSGNSRDIMQNEDIINEAYYYAQRGAAVAVVNYSRVETKNDLCTNFKKIVGMATAEIHAAIQFCVVNSDITNIDVNNIFIVGESAGGIAGSTAIWWSETKYNEKFKDVFNSDGTPFTKTMISKNFTVDYSKTTYSIKAISLFYSGVSYPEVFTERDINRNIPIILQQSNQDPTVPFNNKNQISNLCPDDTLDKKIMKVVGCGFIRDAIEKSSKFDRPKYKMYEYNCCLHINYINLTWVSKVTSEFFYKVLFNQSFSTGTKMKDYCYSKGSMVIRNITYPIILPPECVMGTIINQFENQFLSTETNIINGFNISIDNKELMLTFNTENTSNYTMKLYDISGSLKKQNIITSGQQINIAELQTGIYFILLVNNNSVFKKKVFIE